MPSAAELEYFLASSSRRPQSGGPRRPGFVRLWEDRELAKLHRITGRRGEWRSVKILAFDHRTQFEGLADRFDEPRERISTFKSLVSEAFCQVAQETTAAGVLVDEQYGADVLERLTGMNHWIGRPIEQPGRWPLEFVGGSQVLATIRGWPREHVVKCLVFVEAREASASAAQTSKLLELQYACHELSRELLIEVLPKPSAEAEFDAASWLRQFYEQGLQPDWWKLESPPDATRWLDIGQVIRENDRHCRGLVVLGKNAPLQELARSLREARSYECCQGFAVGRSIFASTAQAWFADAVNDQQAVRQVADNFRYLVRAWEES
jgi:5-dehydro-2-deoxygluconokinase